jgi:hypothetical protein
VTFLGLSAVIKIEATRARLSLLVVVIGVAFSAACFLERLLRHYMRTDIQPNGEPSDVTGSLPKWLNRNLAAKDRPLVPPLVIAWQPKLISKDEMRRIAANIAKLPELLTPNVISNQF